MDILVNGQLSAMIQNRLGRGLLLGSVLLGGVLLAKAQVSSHSFGSAHRIEVLDRGDGSTYLVVEKRFGHDSSVVELHAANEGWTATPLVANRFLAPLYFLFDAAAMPTGPLLSGLLPNADMALLTKYSMDGDVDWNVQVQGMQSLQRRFFKLFVDGSTFTAYSNSDGVFSDDLYRLDGTETGDQWSSAMILGPGGGQSRLVNGVATDTPGEHILVGERRPSGGGALMMMRVAPAGVVWMKEYTLGSATPWYESAIAVASLADGDHVCSFHWMRSDGTLITGLMRFDDEGTPVWTTLVDDDGGVTIHALVELENGDILASASPGARLLVFNANGELQRTRTCPECGMDPIMGLQRSDAIGLVGVSASRIHHLDVEGDACGYSTTTNLGTTSIIPVVTPLIPTMTAAPLMTVGQNTFDRQVTSGLTLDCGASGFGTSVDATGFEAWPTLTTGIVKLSWNGEPVVRGTVRVLGLTGDLMLEASVTGELDLSGLHQGMYIVELPDHGQFLRVIKE